MQSRKHVFLSFYNVTRPWTLCVLEPTTAATHLLTIPLSSIMAAAASTSSAGWSTTTTTSSSSKEYDVQYAGTEHGSRLSPLLTIRSPEPSGAKNCTYTLTSLHPDKPMEWKGSWSVPQA